jgi:CDP-diacylglycerol--glycerol-3-phosphate 3-phosphatidyltransferase
MAVGPREETLPPRTLTARLGALLQPTLDALVRALAHVSADVLTMTGLALTAVAAAFFATAGGLGYANPWLLKVGGVVALVASIFDMLDGRVARLRGRGTQFGAYLDSTMDRYSDMLLYLGLLVLYARVERTGLMVLVWVAAFGSFMTSYARARAESLIPRCPVGLMERPERVVLVIAGALLNRMVAVLWVIAILSNVTAIQRVVYTYVELKRGWSTFFTSPDGRDDEMGKDA